MADIEVKSAALALVNKGVDPHIVAAAFDLPINDVRTLYAQRTVVKTELSPEDKALAERLRTLVSVAIDKAYETLTFGHPEDQQRMVRLLLQRSMGLVGVETTERFDELRTELEDLMEGMTGAPAAIDAASTEAHDPN